MKNKLFEGKYDKLTGIVVDAVWHVIKESKKVYDESGDNIYKVEPIEIKDIITFKLQVLVKRREGAQDFFVDAVASGNTISLAIYLDPGYEPDMYVELNHELQGAVRHEIEHILQEQNFPQKPKLPSKADIDKINKNTYEYLMYDYEVEAMVMGFYRAAKVRKQPLDVVIDQYLKWFVEDESITKNQATRVKHKWLAFAKKTLPKAQYKNKIVRESLDE